MRQRSEWWQKRIPESDDKSGGQQKSEGHRQKAKMRKLMCENKNKHFVCFSLKSSAGHTSIRNENKSSCRQCVFGRRRRGRESEQKPRRNEKSRFQMIISCLVFVTFLRLSLLPFLAFASEHSGENGRIRKRPSSFEFLLYSLRNVAFRTADPSANKNRSAPFRQTNR